MQSKIAQTSRRPKSDRPVGLRMTPYSSCEVAAAKQSLVWTSSEHDSSGLIQEASDEQLSRACQPGFPHSN